MTMTLTETDWSDYITLTNNLDLEFKANDNLLCNTQLIQELKQLSSVEAIEQIIDCFQNQGYSLIEPWEIGALTDSQIITDGYNYWWFPTYQVCCPIDELIRYGKFTFTYGGSESEEHKGNE